jgi:hypothetical protein
MFAQNTFCNEPFKCKNYFFVGRGVMGCNWDLGGDHQHYGLSNWHDVVGY